MMVASAELASIYQQLSCIGDLKLNVVPRCDATSAEYSGRIITCLDLLAVRLMIQFRMLLANFIAKELLSASTPWALPTEQPSVLSLYPCQGFFLPGAGLSTFPC